MPDWVAHYDVIYSTLGVDGEITVSETQGPLALRVIDKSAGIPIGDPQNGEVVRMVPAATARVAELAERGLSAAGVDGATLDMNGETWSIESHGFAPAPTGQAAGEIVLYLRGT